MKCKCIKEYFIISHYEVDNVYDYTVDRITADTYIYTIINKKSDTESSKLHIHDIVFNEHFMDISKYRDSQIEKIIGYEM